MHPPGHVPGQRPRSLERRERVDRNVPLPRRARRSARIREGPVIGNETVRNQAESLAEELGYEHTFSSTDPVGSPKRYGNAILTRHPQVRRGWKRLRPLDDSRTAAHVRIVLGDRAANVYVTHLHHTAEGASIRAQQVADLLAFVRETGGGAPSIVAGDLHAESGNPRVGGSWPEPAASLIRRGERLCVK